MHDGTHIKIICDIWGPYGCLCEYYRSVGRDAVYFVRQISPFWINLLLPSLRAEEIMKGPIFPNINIYLYQHTVLAHTRP